MQYVLSADWREGAAHLTDTLITLLKENKKVLWLVCGGSNIAAEVQIMNEIPAELTGGLTITLTDERFGEVGHQDSNWRQLRQAGFDFKQARTIPVLQDDESLEETAARYGQSAKEAFGGSDVVAALFGIGADGHIAGILPGSPAAAETERYSAGYEAGELTRLTLTFPALQQIDIAYAFAFGDSKKGTLAALQAEDRELSEQPAQILKRLPEAVLYSDQIGERS